MANIRLIKRRIKSSQNIAQITRAMEMVAASKMKKAQETAVSGKPYAQKIYDAVHDLSSRIDRRSHPLLGSGNGQGRHLVILISTNKGLCGGLNTNLFRRVWEWFGQEDYDGVSFGKKGQQFMVRIQKKLVADFSGAAHFELGIAPTVSLLSDGFIQGTYKDVYIVYNSFVHALRQEPTRKKILPFDEFVATSGPTESYSEFLIEPSLSDVFESLLPHYLENQIRAAIREAEASEHSARMVAMKNATDSALDLEDALTLVYNKVRQEKITNEIADIVTARMSVE